MIAEITAVEVASALREPSLIRRGCRAEDWHVCFTYALFQNESNRDCLIRPIKTG